MDSQGIFKNKMGQHRQTPSSGTKKNYLTGGAVGGGLSQDYTAEDTGNLGVGTTLNNTYHAKKLSLALPEIPQFGVGGLHPHSNRAGDISSDREDLKRVKPTNSGGGMGLHPSSSLGYDPTGGQPTNGPEGKIMEML